MKLKKVEQYTVIPLRDVVVFPFMVVPIFVGRPRSLRALQIAESTDKKLFLTLQKSSSTDEPEVSDLNNNGVVASILQVLKLPDGTVKILVEGLKRATIVSAKIADGAYMADVSIIEDEAKESGKVSPALKETLLRAFNEYADYTKKISPDLMKSILAIEELSQLSFIVASNITLKTQDLQKILDCKSVSERIEIIVEYIKTEMELLKLDDKIKQRVKNQMAKSQREYFLNEQMKAINKEMGKDDDYKADIEEIEQKFKSLNLPEAVREKADRELKKIKLMPPMSAETTVVRNYLDWLASLPWGILTKDRIDMKNAEDILNRDHYGLEKPKERILEFLAVRKMSDSLKGSILCFVGPPGVGKTSLARSIADAMGRKFIRVSMGGVRDEAEIRGHRKTYIGALPGKIIQSMKKAGSMNPVFLLDEIDKIGSDYRGDPASALLETLDPEQNKTFADHYLEVDFDLSKVFFITTANSLETIPPALLDRMEVIRIPGYTEQEKLNIAKSFLIKKQMKEHAVEDGKITIEDDAILEVIRYYTLEAGVRNLEREIASLIRKAIRKFVTDKKTKKIVIKAKKIEEYLGARKFRMSSVYESKEIGVATGLAWTSYGGDILQIEVVLYEGSGNLMVTGQLGDVMQESAKIALSVVKSVASKMKVPAYMFKDYDIHLHVPEGAVPKDGPSAGITMALAILSAVSERNVDCKIAMTGEITLRGKVLEIGGVKEKVLAAHRSGIRKVILPIDNKKDLTDIPSDVRVEVEFHFVSSFDEVVKLALK